jgi:hypothetical protein
MPAPVRPERLTTQIAEWNCGGYVGVPGAIRATDHHTSRTEVRMKKLNVEALAVESFATATSGPLVPHTVLQCTGCDSTCGIAGSDFTGFFCF